MHRAPRLLPYAVRRFLRLWRAPGPLLIALGCLLFTAAPARALIGVEYQMQLGNPSGATADPNNHSHYLIQRTVQALDYNDALGQPTWASWNLTAFDIGESGRSPKFYVDTNLPTGFYLVGTTEYSRSGYDRGHLCPSADRTDNTNNNNLVFFMSNIMPQTSDMNSGVWNNFESYCRSLVQSTNNSELLITCGPSGFTGAHLNTNGYVAIPGYSWKIVVVVPPGAGMATNRITTATRVIAIKVPNATGVSTDWQDFLTSANQIQVDTGLTFFTGLPPEVAAVLRSRVDGQTNPPPAIATFSPESGPTTTNVVIVGTNFTGASEVTFNGAQAGFSVDSDTQLTATVPTNAASGFISVTTTGGTAISTNDFIVLHNGATIVYSGLLAGWDVSGQTNYGPSPLMAVTHGPHLAVTGLIRGSGVRTSGNGAANAWGGNGWNNAATTAAIAADQFATFSLAAAHGHRLSLSSLSRFDYYHSATGPAQGLLQYQLGTNDFIAITHLDYPAVGSGASLGAIDLSGIAALQEVGPGTNITFRIVNYGGTSSVGTWYIYDTQGSTAPDLALQGSLMEILPVPAAPPELVAVGNTGLQFHFTVTGSVGTNYIVQVTTNLTASTWTAVATNAAPFDYIDTDALAVPQRYYRALVSP